MTKQSPVSVLYSHLSGVCTHWSDFSEPSHVQSEQPQLSASPPRPGLPIPYSSLWPIITFASILSWNREVRIGSSTSYTSLISDYFNSIEHLDTNSKAYIITGHGLLNISKGLLEDSVVSWWAKHKTRNPLDGYFKVIIHDHRLVYCLDYACIEATMPL